MPIHDWTRVSAGIFHDVHNAWITEVRNALNEGVLPSEYYALGEQVVGPYGPDVLTLRTAGLNGRASDPDDGGTAIATRPPKVALTASLESDPYTAKRRSLVIRHSSDDQIIALLEIVSPGNKASQHEIGKFLDKAVEALAAGYHLLLIDLFPPTARDPQGIHGAVWDELGGSPYIAPVDKPLTLAAYSAGWSKTAYVEPIAVGDLLIPMPLFLTSDVYVNVPLEETYLAAYRGVPRRWREVLER